MIENAELHKDKLGPTYEEWLQRKNTDRRNSSVSIGQISQALSTRRGSAANNGESYEEWLKRKNDHRRQTSSSLPDIAKFQELHAKRTSIKPTRVNTRRGSAISHKGFYKVEAWYLD